MRPAGLLLLLAIASLSASAEAKTFRYASGPAPKVDTALAVAEPSLEPIVRSQGPRVPLTNLQMVTVVANVCFHNALQDAPLDSGEVVLLAPAESHPLNFVAEHAILYELAQRHVITTVRRSILPDDSLLIASGDSSIRVLEYQLASARITYPRYRGWLPGRVRIERQAMVEGALTLRSPATGQVLWARPATHNLVDSFPRGQIPLVEDDRFADLKGTPPTRNSTKVLEPLAVVAIVAGLVALFFQNRP
jgi:hypothetical protein